MFILHHPFFLNHFFIISMRRRRHFLSPRTTERAPHRNEKHCEELQRHQAEGLPTKGPDGVDMG
jgi:hypothetical protein